MTFVYMRSCCALIVATNATMLREAAATILLPSSSSSSIFGLRWHTGNRCSCNTAAPAAVRPTNTSLSHEAKPALVPISQIRRLSLETQLQDLHSRRPLFESRRRLPKPHKVSSPMIYCIKPKGRGILALVPCIVVLPHKA